MIGEDADHGLLLMLSCRSRKSNLYINWYFVGVFANQTWISISTWYSVIALTNKIRYLVGVLANQIAIVSNYINYRKRLSLVGVLANQITMVSKYINDRKRFVIGWCPHQLFKRGIISR